MNIKMILLLVFLIYGPIFSQEKLPQIKLKNEQGRLIDISKINTTNVTIFSFWATWCVPCINELDAISEIYTDWQLKTNVNIIAVSIDDARSASRVKPLIQGKNWSYRVLYDTNQEFKRALNVTIIPYLIIVKNNKIVHSQSGYTPGNESALFESIMQYAN